MKKLKNTISNVPQGSIVGSILSKLLFNNFLVFMLIALGHNFADDNSLSNTAAAFESIIRIRI